MLRLIATLVVGGAAIVLSAFLIGQIQGVLERIGYPMPRPLFLGVLAGAVVYVAKLVMDKATHELMRYRSVGGDRKAE